MFNLLASEGGYQEFTLAGGDKFWLLFSGLTSLLAIAVGFYLMRGVLAQDQGTPKMQEIAKAIQEGALAYLKRQFKTIGVILVPLAVIVFFTSTEVINPTDGTAALSFGESGVYRTLAFIAGGFLSGLTGYIGMTLATQGNVRTAAAARNGSMPAALKVAFRTGGVAGMFTVGLGLLGATIIIAVFQNTASAILIGFGFGGSLLALFLRVGGGIFTKAADVGADLVGKVEAGIPEDDPRNPATIADNVGDNVGDCAGMAADLFESYEVTLVASIILGVSAFQSIYPEDPNKWVLGLIFPVIARAIGVLASIVGVFAVRAKEGETNALKPINRGFLTAGILTIIGTAAVALLYVGNDEGTGPDAVSNVGWRVFAAVVIGLVLAQALSRLTEYFTSTETTPVRDIAEAARTGPATTVLSGVASGLESSVYAIILIAVRTRRGDRPRKREPAVLLLPGRAVRHGNARHHGRHRVGGHVRARVRQRRRHRGDVRRVRRRGGAHHGQPRRGRQHDEGRHEGLRHRLSGHRRRRALRLLHRDDRVGTAGGAAPQPQSLRTTDHADQRGRSEDVHRLAHRRVDRVHVLRARDPRRRPDGRCRRARGTTPVRRRQDHER